jgi:type I restriction enzyme, S subunit
VSHPWPLVLLATHVRFLPGFAFKSECFNQDSRGLPLVRIRDLVSCNPATFFDGEYDTRFVVSAGDVLIGMDGEFNISRWTGPKALLNQRVCKIDFVSEHLDLGYLTRFLPGALKAIEDVTSFVTVKHLSTKDLLGIEIPLPPIEEQRRIAAILDKADEIRTKRRAALAQLDTLTQAIFLDLFGDLRHASAKFDVEPLGKHVTVRGGFAFKSEDFASEGLAVVRISNLDGQAMQLGAAARIPESKLGRGRDFEIIANDILIAMSGATTGKLAVVPPVLSERIFQNQRVGLYRIPKDGTLKSEFVRAFLDSEYHRSFVWQSAAGAAQPNISGTQLESVLIPLPSLQLQERFESMIHKVRSTRQCLHAGLANTEQLFASLQGRAFQGEL